MDPNKYDPDNPPCSCMGMLGFKTCDKCIDYQMEHVSAIKERARRWRTLLED